MNCYTQYRSTVVTLLLLASLSLKLIAQDNQSFIEKNIDLKEVGKLKTRHARDISSSTWSIGGETLDRDYADYNAYKSYLGPLGAKRIRLQGGWYKCEPKKGKYNFKWMDDIVNDAHSQGVSPWIELAYGNPIYKGGGEPKLGGALPTSEEALKAWDNWVREMVTRFKGKVTEWEIWNEPDHGKGITGESYALFYIRTARIIKSIQPEAKLLGVALSNLKDTHFVREYCQTLKNNNALDLLDLFVYHGYAAAYGWAYNPDDVYPQIEVIRELVWDFDPSIVFFQGESGAPSTPHPKGGVFKDFKWSEFLQSKWNLRRMLGDHGRGINTSLFAMSDMHYYWGQKGKEIALNTKGILQTNDDKSIKRPKYSYGVAQYVFSLFDKQIDRMPSIEITTDQTNQSFFAYNQKSSGRSLVTIWQNEHPPYKDYKAKRTTVTIENGDFENPVFVDLITGIIYEIPANRWMKIGNTYTFGGIMVPDYPVLITDREVVD